LSGKVGSKGQIVIEKSIRDRLGIDAGTQAVQRLVDDHVEIYFVPSAREQSLKGVLKPHIGNSYKTEEELRNAMETMWAAEGNGTNAAD
jgi:AbrB family looped-hinge helix DNA binding protein